MTVTKVTQEIIDDTLVACRQPVTADELFQNCKADGIPVSYHHCKTIASVSEECINQGGFYNILSRANDQGNVLNFFDNKGELTQSFVIRRPEISRDRKIPKLNWLKQFFFNIGYSADRIEIKYIHRIIESHIRDGGTWLPTFNDKMIIIVLKMNGQVKTHLEFHREECDGQ